MRPSALTTAWRGTPNLDGWVAFIATGGAAKKLIMAHKPSERTVTHLLARMEGMS